MHSSSFYCDFVFELYTYANIFIYWHVSRISVTLTFASDSGTYFMVSILYYVILLIIFMFLSIMSCFYIHN